MLIAVCNWSQVGGVGTFCFSLAVYQLSVQSRHSANSSTQLDILPAEAISFLRPISSEEKCFFVKTSNN